MSRPKSPRGKPDLRQRAEAELVRTRRSDTPPAGIDQRRLVQELQVHQIELELQNDELRAAQVDVEAGLARYIELFEFAPLGYAVVDGEAVMLEINHAGAAILGRDRSELVGNRLGAWVTARDQPRLAALVSAALTSEAKASVELDAYGKRGSRLSLVFTAAMLRGRHAQVLITFEDVTERKAKAQQLERAEGALREANRRKDEFLAALSHELRNPLGPIRNALFLLGHAGGGEEKAHRARAIIERQVAHLTRLVDDLMDVTRIARGKIELKRDIVELGDLVRATMEDHRASFEGSGIRLEGRLDQGAFWVDGDPARLVQVVSNVLGNAQKFTPPGGRVAVTLKTAGQNAELRVRDTGAGIAPQMLAQVFEPFTQAPQTMDRAAGGLGLGLAMVKGFVELHGGAVAIASEGTGRGTEIAIRLPLVRAPAHPVAAAVEPAAPPKSRRVLLIEDNRDAADSLSEALAVKGHEVRVAGDGPTGLARARAFLPEVIICDIGLPRMDGYDVARAVRSDEALKGTYLVALSGYARPEDIQRASDAGFDQHMTKPPIMDELIRVLSDASLPGT